MSVVAQSSSKIVRLLVVKVRVIEHRRSKKLFALKYIEKAKCIKQRSVANVIQERRLLEEVRVLISLWP